MATIQRTFKDPALQNPLKYLGYDSIPVEIEHGGASENYFNVQGIGPELHAGKNIFYIKPDAETLVLNAEIGVEILDANGDLVPVRLLDNRRSDGSIGLVIEVDESRPKGYGQVTIVSVARGEVVGARLQPLRNTDTFNIRWAKRVYINRDGLNTSEITYIRPPQIEVSELKLPYYISHFNTELTSSLSNAITSANPVVQNEITCSIYQLSSSHNTEAKISYIKQREQIYLELTSSDFGGFVQDMENGTVFFDAKNIVGIEPSESALNIQVEDSDGFDDIASEASYFTSILQVLSPTRILVSSPHTTFQGSGQSLHEVMHQEFEPSNFTLTWAMPPYSHSRYPDPEGDETKYLTTYAGVQVRNLDPYSGDVHRIKSYVRAESRPDDYVMCSDLVVESQELLIVSESPHYNKIRFKNIPCGKFDRLNTSTDPTDFRHFEKYWTTTAIGLDAPSLSIVSKSFATDDHTDFVPMRPSLRVGTLGEVSPLDDNVGRNPVETPTAVELRSTVSASFHKDKIYVLEVSGYVKGRDLIELTDKNIGVAHGIGSFTIGPESTAPLQITTANKTTFYNGGVIGGQGSTNPFTVANGKPLSAPRLDIFGTGDAFQDDTNRIGLGKLIGEINNASQPQGTVVDIKKVEGYSGVDHVLEVNFRFPFKADADAIGEFRFEIERGLWYFQEISVKPYHRSGVTPHQYDYLLPLPKGLSHPERRDVFDFMFEFYNIEGHMCAEKVYIDNICMDNEWHLAPTSVVTEIIDNDIGDVTINGPLVINNLTNITSSVGIDITNNFGDIMMYNTSSGEVGHVELGCALGFMDKDNCCCHLHGDTNIYIFIDRTSLNIIGSATATPAILTRWVITKFEKDMRERYPYWKGNIYVGQGSQGVQSGTNMSERWLSWMSWPAVGNQSIDSNGTGSGITGSMTSVNWSANATETSEINGTFVGSDDFHAYGYSASAYYLENSPIAKGVPDSNVIVFALVDETQADYHGGAPSDKNDGSPSDFDDQITDNYKRDYGLFVGKAHPTYNCFTGYVYALPSSNNITHGARQKFALHVYAAIETSAVTPENFIGSTATGANLSAITGSNPYANASSSVGALSQHYQGGIYGLKSQSINEKHDFAGGIAGWYNNLSYPVPSTTINKSGSWAQGQATFSGDLFKFIDGNSIGVRVDGTSICVNDSNELFATNTGSFTGSFTGTFEGDIHITEGPIIIHGGINFWTIEGDFHVGGNEYNYYGGNNTFTSITASHYHITQVTESLNITNTYGDVLMYNSQSEEIGAIALGCGLGFMDKDNCCCHLHGDTNIYIFIDNTSMKLVSSNPHGASAAQYTPQLLARYVIPKFEKDMRERYPYWKGNIYVGQGGQGPGPGTLPAERWLSWMSWPAVGNQNQLGPGTGITGSLTSVKWTPYPAGTTANNEANGEYIGSDDYASQGYSASAYYLENSPIMKDGVPDSNVIVFAMVDETDGGDNASYGRQGAGYHYRNNDASGTAVTDLTGTDADFTNHLTDHYKADYGLFVGKAYPTYDCFSGYVYALPSSQNTTHAARQHFALHIYGAINDGVSSAEFIGGTATGGNLSAITGSNPYGHGSSSVGANSPHYQGGIYGLHSQSIGEKHDFAAGILGWTDSAFSYPVSLTNINKSGSWLRGQTSFSADLFEFIDGDSIGVRVDGTTICINESNELFATNTGSFTGSFTGEITGDTILNIDRSITINGGVNTYIVGDTFIIGGDTITVINTDVTHVTNFTASHYHITQVTESLNVTHAYGDVLMYNSQSEEIGAIALGCGLGFMDKDNCCCHLHGDTNIYIFIDNTSMKVVSSNPHGSSAAQYTPQLLTKWVITKFEKDMRERYPYWKGNIYVGQGASGPGQGTLTAERWLSWMSWPAVGNQTIDADGVGRGISGSMSSVKWTPYPAGTTVNNEVNGEYIGSDDFAAHGYSASAYYLENSPIAKGVPDSNVIEFAMVDETDPGNNNQGDGYHYRNTLTGVASDFNNMLTDDYKRDYGLFIGEAHPKYDCFSGYVYGLPSSQNTTHEARQNFALHIYAAINDRVTSAEFIGTTPTQANLSAITGSNPFGHGSASVGTLSPWYQGAMYGLHSQSISEKHDFDGGIAGWFASNLTYPVSIANANKSGSWLRGQASFSADLFEFVDGDSIGVRVDGTTICVNESNELFATNTGSYTGSFTGEITGDTILNIDNGITINGGVNTYIVGDTFIIGGNNITVFNGDVTHITNLTASNAIITNIDGVSATGSFSGSFDGDARATGSFTGSFTGIGNLTGSFNGEHTGRHTGSFTGSFDGDARLTGSFTGAFAGNLTGTASYGVDNDWYLQGGTDDPTITGDIYHTGKVGVGDFSSATVTHELTVLGDISASGTIYGKEFHTQFVSSSIIYMSGSTKFGDTTDDRADFTGSLQLSHSRMSIFTGSGKLAWGVDHSSAEFTQANTRVAQFYSGSDKGVFLNVTNWETASAFTAAGGSPGDASPSSTNGPRAGVSVNGLNSRTSYGIGGNKGIAGGSISFHPDTYEGNTNGNDVGDGGDVDSLGRRLLQEVFNITTGGNPQPSINIHARGDRGQQIRFFTGNDDARNTGGKEVETQRMTIIHEGLVGIGTHNPQRRLHISESGHKYAGTNGQLVPLRVQNFTEGSANKVLIWDDVHGDVYYKDQEDFTSQGGDTGIGTFIVGSTFIIGPFNVFTNDTSFFGNITASGNISASDPNGIHIFGGSSTFHHITASGNISASDPNGIHTLGGDVTLGVDCTDDLNIKATVTASCNVSISADLYFDRAYGARAIFHDNDANTGIEFASDTITIKENGQQSAVFATTGGNSIGNQSYRTSISGSTITLGDGADHHTTASGHISSSRDLEIRNISASQNLWLNTDASAIHFGADKDILLSHQPDSGLKLSNKFTSLGAGSANSQSSLLGLTLHNDTTTIANNDFIGGIFYTSDTLTEEEGGNSDKTFASIVGQVQIKTPGREAGALYMNVMNAGESSSAVTIKGNQNIITNHFGTKHEQLTTLSSSNSFPLILSSLKNYTHQHYLVWDESTGYVSAKSLEESGGTNTDNGIGNATVGGTLIISTAPVMTNGGTYIIGGGGTLNLTTINEFAIGPIVYLTQNTVINQNLNVLGSLTGDNTIGSNCDDYLLIKSKVTASCIISSSDDIIARDVSFHNITGSGNIKVDSTAPENYFAGAINVRHDNRHVQSNINATEMGDDVSIFEGSLIVGERANQNGIPNNAIINGAESLIVGQGNAVTNQNARSIVMGYNNSGSGLANLVGGSAGNKGLSDVTMVFGYGNHNEDNDGGIVLGSYNHISATGTNGHHAIGTSLVNSGSNGGNKHNAGSMVLGRFNKRGVVDAIFTIGDGKADATRRDLLVARSGSIEILGHVTQSGNISITGILEASQKSFVIPHPTKQGKKLVYGVLEGPEHAVYVRGKVDTNYIDLPEEWIGLVDEDSITVQLTPIGKHQNLYVDEINNTKILIKNSNLLTKSINAFYFIQGTRKDIQPLQTERDA